MNNLEALKRGLFLLWYSTLEPIWLTGIGELDKKSEERIIKILDGRLKSESADYELDWMLNYYSHWDYIFERFSCFQNFQEKLKSEYKTKLPEELDRKAMEQRGQMGIYWNSLEIFNK